MKRRSGPPSARRLRDKAPGAVPLVEFTCSGHAQVSATHSGTFELVSETSLTAAGTCIIGVGASPDEGQLLQLRGEVKITLTCSDASDSVRGFVNPLYVSGDPLVFRKHIKPQPRSLCIACDKDSADLDRRLVRALGVPGAQLRVRIESARRDVTRAGGGVLYLLGSTLGNPEDLSPRTPRILRSLDLILVEDTRTVRPLLKAAGASAPAISYHDHNEAQRLAQVLRELDGGARVGVIAEAGMPLVSDPGFRIVEAAIKHGHLVTAVPSGDAVTTALCVSGMSVAKYSFVGFLPRRQSERRSALVELDALPWTFAFFESRHRIEATLADICTVMPERAIAVCVDLTKRTERVVRGTANQVLEVCHSRPLLGELTVVVQGRGRVAQRVEASEEMQRAVNSLVESGVSTKTIAKALAAASGMRRRNAFAEVLELRNAAYPDDPGG